ncbi:YfhO family protein [Porphyromonas gingivalis]|uniref:YfhO family protein n=1 Tax=Porphyromonas gingivalis TaxID=837 RepID=UPI001F220565|nr:YfhO family protein [Porphyromonas gingivalis]MCE8171893.1 hypothetical protein [Porphyromonas gingivalis]
MKENEKPTAAAGTVTTTDKTKPDWRKILPYAAVVLLFIALALAYFYPASFDGRVLFQGDVAGASGTAQDVRDWEAQTGEHSYWTNSLFGGMPMYQISPSYPSTHTLQTIQDVLTLRKPFYLLGTYAWMLFAMMGGFFLFLRSLRIRILPAVIGSIAWAFSSYFLILIMAGHIWKLTAMCFIPPTLAGMIWIYNGRWLAGGSVMAFFTALQVLANHVQMSYYFLFVMFFMVLAFLAEAIQTKRIRHFFLSSAVVVIAGLVGVAVNSTNLFHTYQYGKETMRGGSELTLKQSGALTDQVTHENKSGLDKAYITQWSYGIGETWSLLIPDIKGGSSGYLGYDEKVMETVNPSYAQAIARMNRYWGDQPFTAGPVYVGAFVLFLFVLGCFIVKGPVKWALLAATILSILLSWGYNMMWLTSFFIDHFPLYDKFRTVSSILVIAEFTIPALAVMALVEIIKEGKPLLKRERTAWVAATLLTLGASLLFALVPSLLGLLSGQEEAMFREAAGHPEAAAIKTTLVDVRSGILASDAWRSFGILVVCGILLWLFFQKRLKATALLVSLAVITLVDLWTVDKRYLNDEHFIDPELVSQRAAPQTEADKQILADKSLGYRVLNLTVDTYNDATTSRWHRSIGGYHAAKLQRYQDLIEHQLSKGNREVVNMLNTKYIIVPGENNRPTPMLNPDAYGPAWPAGSIRWVGNANEEMMALDNNRLTRDVAVVNERFSSESLKRLPALTDSTASISLKEYAPNRQVYEAVSTQPMLGIFSEIYYPHGWTATIDNQAVPIIRANYILRALEVPAGRHKIEFRFDPKSLHITEAIAKTALALLLLGIVWAIARPFFLRGKRPTA